MVDVHYSSSSVKTKAAFEQGRKEIEEAGGQRLNSSMLNKHYHFIFMVVAFFFFFLCVAITLGEDTELAKQSLGKILAGIFQGL